ncbi:hypothetical protein NM208_g13680 [Fusarium decemcellulare]|uniref:Uncharacterized protein n=1 Tax=Fusarium decemcellulare TaxID=57161 RepID=A0ACC1RME6_9HYPO|nr:hypothetical protein NM208_g13680 [Fusarium decemcellulare]
MPCGPTTATASVLTSQVPLFDSQSRRITEDKVEVLMLWLPHYPGSPREIGGVEPAHRGFDDQVLYFRNLLFSLYLAAGRYDQKQSLGDYTGMAWLSWSVQEAPLGEQELSNEYLCWAPPTPSFGCSQQPVRMEHFVVGVSELE